MTEPTIEEKRTQFRVWAVASLIIAIAFLIHPVRISIYKKGIRFLEGYGPGSNQVR
jgi:hypothetical protein